MIKRILALFLITMFLSEGFAFSASATTVRVKDIAHVNGIRDNQLVGYGLVTGLSNTGDNSRSTQITNQNLLNNLGTTIENFNDIKKGNSAAVIVTAIVPPFAKNGDRIDVIVSSMADAKSLEGGILIQTQLKAPNGEVVAVAQGPISVAGTDQSANGSSVRTTITTSGRIPGGAIVERDINTVIGDDTGIKLVLNKPDYTMVARITQAINTNIGRAQAIDGNSIQVYIPDGFANDRVGFLSMVENLVVTMNDNPAKVVINERTGTVVIGNEVKLLPAAIAHGNLTVSISTSYEISQPNAFAPSGAMTAVVPTSEINVDKSNGRLIELPANSNLSQLVRALNAIGVAPIDLISILQALKAAGSLQATIEII